MKNLILVISRFLKKRVVLDEGSFLIHGDVNKNGKIMVFANLDEKEFKRLLAMVKAPKESL